MLNKKYDFLLYKYPWIIAFVIYTHPNITFLKIVDYMLYIVDTELFFLKKKKIKIKKSVLYL